MVSTSGSNWLGFHLKDIFEPNIGKISNKLNLPGPGQGEILEKEILWSWSHPKMLILTNFVNVRGNISKFGLCFWFVETGKVNSFATKVACEGLSD